MTVTLSDMVPEVVVTVAVILAVPAATPVTTPELLTVAILVVSEVQATWVVRVLVLLSSKVPVAVSEVVEPVFTVGLVGVMEMLVSARVLTMTVPEAVMPSCEALMVEFPAATAVTRPALTDATPDEELVHLAELVTSLLLPSTVVPLAVNCLVSPTLRKMEVGVIVMELSAPPETKKSPHPLLNSERRRTRSRTAVELGVRITALMFRIMREFYQKRLLRGSRLGKES